MKCFVAVVALASLAASAPAPMKVLRPYIRVARDSTPEPEPQYQPQPSYQPAPSYHEPAYPDVAPEYSFGYVVRDDYAGLEFDANEQRDNYATQGGYSVLLPDGRTQHVTYRVDDAYSGYIAEVSYEGEPRYDSYEPAPSSYEPSPYESSYYQ